MNETTIILKATEEVPINVTIHSYDFTVQQYHKETELLFCLNGEFDLVISDRTYHMIPEDICLINRNEVHYVSSNSFGSALSVTFPLDAIPGFYNHHPRFRLSSCGNTHSHKYDYVRALIARLVKVNIAGEDPLTSMSILYALLHHLDDQFKVPPEENEFSSSGNSSLIIRAMDYLQTHYKENLSLSDLADAMHVSVPYMSSCFDKHLGTTFLKYYNDLRLNRAVHDMLITTDSLEEIAARSGFGEVRAFTAAFKKRYNTLPSKYRRENRLAGAVPPGQKISSGGTEPAEPLSQDSLYDDDLASLSKYLSVGDDGTQDSRLISRDIKVYDAGTLDFQQEGVPLKHTFKNMLCVGSARQLLYADVQDLVRRVQNEIGYKYVKFHGILSDEMMVYDETPDGTPSYSFVMIDKVMDFLMSVNLRPLVQLSFMPIKLASDPERLIDSFHFNTSPPKSMTKWANLVEAVVSHLITRYGIEEVSGWLFCVWNEPDSTVEMFGWEDEYLFREFYRRTYATVKGISQRLRFGTPSLLVSPESTDSWTGRFLGYCKTYECQPDFLNVHYYDNNFEAMLRDKATHDETFSISNQSRHTPLTEDPFAFDKFINELKKSARKFNMKHLPVYLTEWNLTVSHRDPINDTCFKSCYLTKNLLQNYDRINSFGYWCLTDFHEEMPVPDSLYHGGLGMFTYNKIPKAHYHAFRLLAKVGDDMLQNAYGYFITRKDNGLVMVLYNYEHYSKMFAKGIMYDADASNRYEGFVDKRDAKFSVHIEKFPTTHCAIREHVINQDYGSSYDAWFRMGGGALHTAEDYRILDELSNPMVSVRETRVRNGELDYSAVLKPLEVRLVEIFPTE